MFYGGILHLNLESVAYKLYFIELYGFQNLAFVTHKTCGGILNINPRNKAHINRGKITHQHTAHGPVYHVNTFNVPRAYCRVGTIKAGLF